MERRLERFPVEFSDYSLKEGRSCLVLSFSGFLNISRPFFLKRALFSLPLLIYFHRQLFVDAFEECVALAEKNHQDLERMSLLSTFSSELSSPSLAP